MKAHVDKDTCIGCELCPEIFKIEDDGKAVALPDEVSENLVSSAKEAKEQCPVGAIIVE